MTDRPSEAAPEVPEVAEPPKWLTQGAWRISYFGVLAAFTAATVTRGYASTAIATVALLIYGDPTAAVATRRRLGSAVAGAFSRLR